MRILKLSTRFLQIIKNEILKYAERGVETKIMGIFKKLKMGTYTIYIPVELVVPEEEDIERRPYSCIETTEYYEKFLERYFEFHNKDKNYVIFDIHSHWFTVGCPNFSNIDISGYKARIAEFRAFSETELVTVVTNKDLSSLKALVWEGPDLCYEFDEIILLGPPFKKFMKNKQSFDNKERYSRHLLIPEWDQELISSLRVGVVGLGGNGAQIIEYIARLGIGENAKVVLVDHDTIEESNLSRLVYALPNNVGKYKVNVAKEYLLNISPNRKVIAINKEVWAKESLEKLSECDIIFNCTDNDLSRTIVSYLCANFLIPLIDTGCGVTVTEKGVYAGGNVSLFVPDNNEFPCGFCSSNLKWENVDLEYQRLKFKNTKKIQNVNIDTPYLQVLREETPPQPSVINLNVMTCNIAITVLIMLLNSKKIPQSIYFDLEKFNLTKLICESELFCNICFPPSLQRGEILTLEDLFEDKIEEIPSIEET